MSKPVIPPWLAFSAVLSALADGLTMASPSSKWTRHRNGTWALHKVIEDVCPLALKKFPQTLLIPLTTGVVVGAGARFITSTKSPYTPVTPVQMAPAADWAAIALAEPPIEKVDPGLMPGL